MATQTVKIATSNTAKYQTIIRAAMAGAKAAKELNHFDEMDEFMKLKHWADKKLDYMMQV